MGSSKRYERKSSHSSFELWINSSFQIFISTNHYPNKMNGADPMNEEERSYELPDGSIIQIDHKSRFPCTEILFE